MELEETTVFRGKAQAAPAPECQHQKMNKASVQSKCSRLSGAMEEMTGRGGEVSRQNIADLC
jgi:hypothetical protein